MEELVKVGLSGTGIKIYWKWLRMDKAEVFAIYNK